jgi:hypothetical protein
VAASIGTALLTASSALAWSVTMTAEPKLKRTHSWQIEKSVSQSALTLKAGETADVTYTVTATPTGSVDSDWSVSGSVLMTEDPNITVATLRVLIEPDDTLAPVECVPAPFPVELGVEGLKCDYYSTLPDASGPRNAWMRATQINGNIRNARATFDFSNPIVDSVDETVTVTDSMGGTLGTVNAADGPKTYTYTKTIGPFTTAQCGQQTVNNTAVYTAGDSGATGNASAAVDVTVTCPPPPTPKCQLPSLVWGFAAAIGPHYFSSLLPVSLGTAGGAKTVNVSTAMQVILVSAQELMTTNGIALLQTELLAAKLNAATGRDVSSIASTMAAADEFLAANGTSAWSSFSSSKKSQVNGWVNTLEAYNNKCIPDHGHGDHDYCKKHWDKPDHDWKKWKWHKFDWDD